MPPVTSPSESNNKGSWETAFDALHRQGLEAFGPRGEP